MNLPRERIPLSDQDPSIPSFHFPENERVAMREKGMSEEEIRAKEEAITNRLAKNKLDDEQRRAA